MSKTVGSFDAKTHLPALLRRAQAGEKITITHRGKPVAMLVPPEREGGKKDIREVIDAMRELAKKSTLRGLSIKAMIEEGRM